MTRIRRLVGTAGLALALALTGLVATPGTAQASARSSVLMIHGFDFTGGGHDCAATWGNQRNALRALGHTGRIQTIGWYSNNRNCERNAFSREYTDDFLGDVTKEGGTEANTLTKNTTLFHVAYRVAWAIAKEAKENGGQDIQVIAHSTGGLLMRLIMQQASDGNPNYPPLRDMRVTAVHGYGVPHNGAVVAWADVLLGNTVQGQELRPGSAVVTQLQDAPRVGSAKWYSFTSTYFNNPTGIGDGVVGEWSACWDRSLVCHRYENPPYRHTTALPGFSPTYMSDTEIAVPRRASARTAIPVVGRPLVWSNLTDSVGAPGITANRIIGS